MKTIVMTFGRVVIAALALNAIVAVDAGAGIYAGVGVLSKSVSVCFVGKAETLRWGRVQSVLDHIREFESAGNIRFSTEPITCPAGTMRSDGTSHFDGDIRVLLQGIGIPWGGPVPGSWCEMHLDGGVYDTKYDSGPWARFPNTKAADHACLYNLKLGDPRPARSAVPYRNHTLHEFGHALGLAHEHIRVEADPTCAPDESKWVASALTTSYDRISVMHYTCGMTGFGEWGDTGLSDLDRLSIHILYPEDNQVAEYVGATDVPSINLGYGRVVLQSAWGVRGANLDVAAKNFEWKVVGEWVSNIRVNFQRTEPVLDVELPEGTYDFQFAYSDFLDRRYSYAGIIRVLSPTDYTTALPTDYTTALPMPPTTPTALPGDGQARITWFPNLWPFLRGEISYNLYMASESGVTAKNYQRLRGGMKHTGVRPPYTHTGLTNGTTYYFVITAVNFAGESRESTEVSTTPVVLEEVCDGIDNDRDGLIDEGFADQDYDKIADCVDTDDDNDGVSDTDEIAAGSDPLNAHSTPEICDGIDNDRDGLIDEGFSDQDYDKIADCVDTDDDNDGVSDTDEITAGSDPWDAHSTPEICDGVDNDLDGFVDDGFPDANNNGIADCLDSTNPLGNPNLIRLTLSAGTLSPPFDPAVTHYTMTVGALMDLTYVTVAPADAGAMVTVNGQSLAPTGVGRDLKGGPFPLVAGDNILAIHVSTPRGVSKDYEVTVTRRDVASLGNPDLVSLTLSAGALSLQFDPAVTQYTVNVGFSVSSTDVTVVPADAGATVTATVNWPVDIQQFVPTGVGTELRGGPFPLAEGDNSLIIQVNTPGGAFNVYRVIVTRQSVAAFAQQAYIKASNTGAGDSFGASVSLYGDILAVGAPVEDSSNGNQGDNNAPNSGAVYIFVRQGSTWIQEAYLKASNTGSGDYFGESISLYGDILAVGAPFEDSSNGNQGDNNAPDSGAVYIFVRQGSTWIQEAYLKAPRSRGGTGDNFGWSVSLFGGTLAVGAPLEDSRATGVYGDQSDNNAPDSGAVYIFVRNGTTWSHQAYIKASNTDSRDQFGDSVSLSGNTLAVGAPVEGSSATGVDGDQSNNNTPYSGAVYIFSRSQSILWYQQAYLKASNTGNGDYFGDSVSLYGDILAVGAPFEDSRAGGLNGDQSNNSAPDSGAVYMFMRQGSTWIQEAYQKAIYTNVGDQFGISVSLSGNALAVGANGEDSSATVVGDNGAPSSGAVTLFVREGLGWSYAAYLKASNAEASDYFGRSVSLSGDALAVGAPGEDSSNGNQGDNNAPNSGAAYLFQ